MAIADDYAAIARAMKRDPWRAERVAAFQCDAPLKVPPELSRRFFAVDCDKPLTEADIDPIARWIHLEICGPGDDG
jgi:hypothetical protein